MGPTTLGLPMNLPPSVSNLQSFGHVNVSEDGLLTIKLIDITGKVMYEKFMEPDHISDELPITTTDVFVQSGEISDSSGIIMVRCNSEKDSKVSITINGAASVEDTFVFAARDYTASVLVKGLSSDTRYYYSARCIPLDGSIATRSGGASFKTAPAEDDEGAVNFVWVGDLSGQGWGRNPDFEVTHVSGQVSYIYYESILFI
jgi:phosphodiesterase/alkaline phosphatase D-like protein